MAAPGERHLSLKAAPDRSEARRGEGRRQGDGGRTCRLSHSAGMVSAHVAIRGPVSHSETLSGCSRPSQQRVCVCLESFCLIRM